MSYVFLFYSFSLSIQFLYFQIVEELEDRLAERMEEVISHVQESLVLDPALIPAPREMDASKNTNAVDEGENWEVDEEYVIEEFDDKGEGVGVEGDLDMNDD